MVRRKLSRQLRTREEIEIVMYDISFIYSKACDLRCSFCMYSSEPGLVEHIDVAKLKVWLSTVDMSKVRSFGVYGGEVSINIAGFSECLDLVNHLNKPQFVITNGTWSTDAELTSRFLEFCVKYRLFIVISGTPEHRKFQNRDILELIKKEFPDAVRLKPEEENFYAMGRLEGVISNTCTEKCKWWGDALRIAVQPDESIIFQSCDGKYPNTLGTLNEAFSDLDAKIVECRVSGFYNYCGVRPTPTGV